MRITLLNKLVWTKAVRPSGKSSGSRENSKAASGRGRQASTTIECYMEGCGERGTSCDKKYFSEVV
jgi:hypothetical protein